MSTPCYQWNHNFPQIARESGFRLKRPLGDTLDWRLIGSIDVEWLIKENDLDRLDSVQSHLSAAPLSSLLLHNSVLDPSVVKYFELAQLSIQFLLFCKQFLDQSVTTLRNNFGELRRKNEKLERLCKRRNEELLAIHSQQQQQPRSSGQKGPVCGSATTTTLEPSHNSRTLVCPKCCKNAINSSGMEIEKTTTTNVGQPPVSHREITKASIKESQDYDYGGGCSYDDIVDEDNRFPAAAGGEENRSQRIENRDINLINAIKLELEVKHLRARLAEVEMELGESREKGLGSFKNQQQPVPAKNDDDAKQELRELRDVGVQIDGISIVHQTEKASVILDSSHLESTAAAAAVQVNSSAVEGVTAAAAAGEERLMALVQEQLSKVLEQWTTTTTTMSWKPEEDALKQESKPDRMNVHSSAAVSLATSQIRLSRKPTEIISIAAEMAPAPVRQQDAVGVDDVRRLLQHEVRVIEKHWQSKYNELEVALHDSTRRAEELVAKLEREDEQPKMTDRVFNWDVGEGDSCRQQSRHVFAEQPSPLRRIKEEEEEEALTMSGKIDKNELLIPQVGGINTENWQPLSPTNRHLPHSQSDRPLRPLQVAVSAKRVQSGSIHKTVEGPLWQFSSPTRTRPASESSSSSSSATLTPDEDSAEEEEDEEDEEGEMTNNLLSVGPATTRSDAMESDSSVERRRRSRSKEVSGKTTNVPSAVTEAGVRTKVIRELNDRLLDMGIQATRTGITGAVLKSATCRLADERDVRKSKWKKFFVIRNRLVAKVNGLVAAGGSWEQKIIQEVLRQEVKQPTPGKMSMEMRLPGDLKSKGGGSGQASTLTSRWETAPPNEAQQRQRRRRRRPRDGSEISDAPSPNLVTMFNRIQDEHDAADTDDDSLAGAAASTGVFLPTKREEDDDEPLRKAPPKPLPRKVLFNLSENNRKLDSWESLTSSSGGVPGKEVRNE